MLKLHGFSVSNYSNMVKQCLLEKGIEFEQLDARPGQEAEFLAKSPMGKIPCLETSEGFLTETPVILNYLEEVYPESPMYPTDPFAKAKAEEIILVSALYIELVARRHLGFTHFGRERCEVAYTEVRPQVGKGLQALQKLASFDPYVMGSEFGNADIFLYHSVRLARDILKRTYDWDIMEEMPELAAHAAAMDERDITKLVIADHEQAMAALMAQLAAAK